jgi:hypothetical protein
MAEAMSVPTIFLPCPAHVNMQEYSRASMIHSVFIWPQSYDGLFGLLQEHKKDSSDFSLFYESKIFFTLIE